MPPPPERWNHIKAVFEAALQAPPAERTALVEAAELSAEERAELRSLLQHHDEATGGRDFLGSPAAPDQAPRTGQRLGAWEIVRPIGSGGMGEVFEARRADGSYEGRAAIKLLKRGMDSAAVLQRFAQERQALARLSHPHIATLLDAGASADGLPYFVMAYVDGQPIDAASRGLPLAQRLALFLQLADAVAYAHRNLLVHRDLKPGNVLVDGEGQVQLLDFGIAKALDPLEGVDGEVTLGGVRPYTPHYASPEQVRGEPVSTATDIYSLGVLLYEMLTGQRPTGRGATTPAEAARGVLEDEPARTQLGGDLDNILRKALEKAPERRYASVEALAADLRACLEGRPVSARPASFGYVAGKFVRRHRAAVAGAATAVLALVLGLGMALQQAHVAELARTRADQQLASVKALLRGLVLRYSFGVWLTPKGGKLMQAFVEDALPRLEAALAAAPEDLELAAIAADLYSRLAEMLGSYSVATPGGAITAQRAAERAIALGERALPGRRGDGAFVARLATARLTLATLAQQAGKPTDGLAQLDAAMRDIDAALPLATDAAGHAFLRGARGSAYMYRGQLFDHGSQSGLNQPADALAQFELALKEFDLFLADKAGIAAITAAAPEDDIDTEASVLQAVGATRTSMAMVHLKQGQLPPAQAEAQRALAIYRRIVDGFPPNVVFSDGLVTAANLTAHLTLRNGDGAAALQAASTAWDANNRLIASEGPKSKWAALRPWVAVQYGGALRQAGRHADALPVLREAAEHWLAQVQANPQAPTAQRSMRRSAQARLDLARAEQALGRRVEALASVASGIQVLAPAAADARRGADTLLLQAELHGLRAELAPAGAAADRAVARQAAKDTLALPALATDQRTLAGWLAR